jgi:hypothetical protein
MLSRKGCRVFSIGAMVLGAGLTAIPLTGCTATASVSATSDEEDYGDVEVQERPPVVQDEVIGARPGPANEYAWVKGHWVWRHQWVWSKGHWQHVRGNYHTWVGGEWRAKGSGYVWVNGHWE